MPSYLLIPILVVLYAGSSLTASAGTPPDLPTLEQAWHSCVRESYARQPTIQSRLAAQRSALDECKGYEDTYVVSVLAAQIAEEEENWRRQRSVTASAKSWAAYVAVYFVDPLSSWLKRWKH